MINHRKHLKVSPTTNWKYCPTSVDPLFFLYLPQGFKLLRVYPNHYDTTYVFEYDNKFYDLYLNFGLCGHLTCLKADTNNDIDIIDELCVDFDIGYIEDKIELMKQISQHLLKCIEELHNQINDDN